MIRAIILAAGRGSRMENLTEKKPKCLVQLGGKTLLERQLAALGKAGIGQISIVTGYRREMLSGYGLREFFNSKWAETSMVSSLECADPWLEQGPCLVSYSDIFFTHDSVVQLVKAGTDIAITYDPNWQVLWEKRFGDPLLDAETFQINQSGILTEIGGKPGTVREIQGQYMGLLYFTPKGWNEVKRIRAGCSQPQKDAMDMTGLLQQVILAGKMPVHALACQGRWGEIDSPKDLETAENMLCEGTISRKSPPEA